MGPDLTLISEPEAAAVYTLQAVQPNHLKKGDNFVVCDAGGGTVDLISYEIKDTRPLRIEESAEGSGACCGGVLLNVRFEGLIRSKLGEAKFSKLCSKQPKTWQTAMRYFEEYVKRNLDPMHLSDFDIPFAGVADDEAAGIEQGFLTLTWTEVASIFTPIVKKVILLVDGQIERLRAKGKTVAGIVLVGGFGQSKCLRTHLKMRFANQQSASSSQFKTDRKVSGRTIEVFQPQNAWTAVVRGAVLRGLEGVEMVLTRKSRRHYGVRCSRTFDPTIYPQSCKAWDDLSEEYVARDRLTWFIKKGQTVSSAEPVQFDFYREFTSGSSKTVTEKLIVCDDDDAPGGMGQQEASSARVLCQMVVNLSDVPAHLFVERRNAQNRPFQTLDCSLGMQIESGGLKFDVRVDDVVYKSVTATFD